MIGYLCPHCPYMCISLVRAYQHLNRYHATMK
jgi:hypothetical protein